MSWQVVVNGPDAVLGKLASALRDEGGASLVYEAERWLLRSPRFDQLADARPVRADAELLLTNLSAAARMRLGTAAAITVGGVEDLHADGTRHAYISADCTLASTLRGTLTALGAAPPPSPEVCAVRLARLALKDVAVAKVLRLRDQGEMNWGDLYKILEVIEADLEPKSPSDLPGSTKAQIRNFKHTANHPGAAGDGARHGAQTADPPGNPMSLTDSRSFIDLLCQGWLALKGV